MKSNACVLMDAGIALAGKRNGFFTAAGRAADFGGRFPRIPIFGGREWLLRNSGRWVYNRESVRSSAKALGGCCSGGGNRRGRNSLRLSEPAARAGGMVQLPVHETVRKKNRPGKAVYSQAHNGIIWSQGGFLWTLRCWQWATW